MPGTPESGHRPRRRARLEQLPEIADQLAPELEGVSAGFQRVLGNQEVIRSLKGESELTGPVVAELAMSALGVEPPSGSLSSGIATGGPVVEAALGRLPTPQLPPGLDRVLGGGNPLEQVQDQLGGLGQHLPGLGGGSGRGGGGAGEAHGDGTGVDLGELLQGVLGKQLKAMLQAMKDELPEPLGALVDELDLGGLDTGHIPDALLDLLGLGMGEESQPGGEASGGRGGRAPPQSPAPGLGGLPGPLADLAGNGPRGLVDDLLGEGSPLSLEGLGDELLAMLKSRISGLFEDLPPELREQLAALIAAHRQAEA